MQLEATFPMALRGRPFRVREALHRGVSAGRLRSRALLRPFHGIRSWTRPTTHEQRARAVLPRLRPDQAFSHTTAAAILGIPLPRRLERDPRLHVTTLGTDQAIRVCGTVGHRARRGRVRTVHSGTAALTHPADTFIALATMLSRDELIVVGDALVGWLGWCDRDELVAAARRYRGARGIRRVRAALEEIRPGSRSPGETRLRLALTRRGLPQPALNHDVVVDGRWVACVDLAYPAARVAIEYESDLHRTDDRTFRKDLTRGEHLKDVGWWLVRATADDVGADVEVFVARVRRLISGVPAGRHDPRPTRRLATSG
jgi:very-short-patch-repair endonuclease